MHRGATETDVGENNSNSGPEPTKHVVLETTSIFVIDGRDIV